jgi:cytoskeleton-associated protein 5
LIAEIEKDWVRAVHIKQTQLPEIDLMFADQKIEIKTSNGYGYPAERLDHLLTKSPQRPHSANVSLYSVSSPQHYSPSSVRPSTAPASDFMKMASPKLDTKLLNLIKGIGHPDRLVSHASLNEVADIMESQEKQAVLRDYDEIYIESVLEQFKVRLLKKKLKV